MPIPPGAPRLVAAAMALELAAALANGDPPTRQVFIRAYFEQLQNDEGLSFDDTLAFVGLMKEMTVALRSYWKPLEEKRRLQFGGDLLQDGSAVRPWHPRSDGDEVNKRQQEELRGEKLVRFVFADGTWCVLPVGKAWISMWKKYGYGDASGWEALVPVESLESGLKDFLESMGVGDVLLQWGPWLGNDDGSHQERLMNGLFAIKGPGLPRALVERWNVMQAERLAKCHWGTYRRDYDPDLLKKGVEKECSELEQGEDAEERRERYTDILRKLGPEYNDFTTERQCQYESELLQKLAMQPGVLALPRGVLCMVEPGEGRLEEIDSAVIISSPNNVTYREKNIDVGFLPDFIRREAEKLPKGMSWTFWIPGSALDWTPELQRRKEREKLLAELAPAQSEHRRKAQASQPREQSSFHRLKSMKVWKSREGKHASSPGADGTN